MSRPAMLCASLLLTTFPARAQVTPDPVVNERQELVGLDTAAGDRFGTSVCIRGDTLVVGASRDSHSGLGNAGSVYVFEKSGSTWSQADKLVASDATAFDLFGRAVDLDGDTLLVGAVNDDSGATNTGSAYVFVRSGTTWSEQAKLVASDPDQNDHFGQAVAVDGDTAVIGAPGDDEDALNAGATYVFVRSGTTWSQQAKLLAGGSEEDLLGGSVDVSGDHLITGAKGLGPVTASGGAHIFARTGTSWGLQSTIVGVNGTGDLHAAVALEGDFAMVSGRNRSFRLERSGTTWSEVGPDVFDAFVFGDDACALDGDTNLVGNRLYRRGDTVWSRQLQYVAGDGAGFDEEYAGTVGVSGDVVVIGASRSDEAGTESGSVYVFDLTDPYPYFCTGNHAAFVCPCMVAVNFYGGCDTPTNPAGLSLAVLAQETTPMNRATLQASGYPPMGNPTALLIRGTDLDPAGPVLFGDGARCVSLPIVRLSVSVGVGGVSLHTFGHSAMTGAGTFYYQLWFRSNPAPFCTPDSFNLSDGRILTW